MPSIRIFSLVCILTLILATHSCTPNPPTETAAAFFGSPRFKGGYFKTLDLWSPESVVQHIEAEVPAHLQGLACEGVYYRLPEDMPDSLIFRHIDLYEKTFPHDTVLVVTQGLRGRLLMQQNRFDTALVCLTASAALAKKINSAHRMGDAQYYLGGFYKRQDNYPEAIKRLQEAYDAFALLPESSSNGQLAETMMALGNAYERIKDYATAQVWHQQALDLAGKYKSNGYKIQAAAAIAHDYLLLHRLDSAKIMIDTAFYYQNLYQNPYNEATRYHILGQIEVAQGNCTAGLSHFQKAQQTNLEIEDAAAVHRYTEGVADAYMCLGRIDAALALYQKALATPDKTAQVRIHEQLGKVYAQKGNAALALTHDLAGKRLSDSLFTVEKTKEIGRLEAKKNLAQREQAVAADAQRIETNRLIIVGFLSVLSMGLVLLALWGYRKKRGERLAQQEKESIAAREALKTQALAQSEQALATKEKALAQVEQTLEAQETALSASTEQINLKDTLIQELEMKLTVQTWGGDPSVSDPLEKEKLQNLKILTAEDWVKFLQLFNQHQPDFIAQVTARFPKLTASEMRLVLLLQLKFDVGEIATVLGIAIKSVYTNRHRLRQKLGLSETDDLEGFIQGF
jgi:tetratricopeptide (TPR) repeat protein